MEMKYLFIISLIITSIYSHVVIGQDSYSELNKLAFKKKEKSLKIENIQKQLSTFIDNNDTLNIANAYYFLSQLKTNDKIAYIDSIIVITKNKNYFRHPALSYLQKGNLQFELGNYTESLRLYITSLEASKKSGNQEQYESTKFNIGLLKNTVGDYKESQTIFADYIKFLQQNTKYKKQSNYNLGLFALADSYIHTKELTLAKNIIDTGIKETLKTKDSSTYSFILVTSGIHQYLSNNYQKAIDSLQKGKTMIKKFDPLINRIAGCDYYIGKSYLEIGNKEQSIRYFKSVDTILRKTKDVIPETLEIYDYLREYAKSINDYKLQIEYIDIQLELDSILHANQVYLTKNITKKYDNAELISEKDKLIKELETNTFLKNNTIILLILFLITLALITIYGFRRNHINKKRFQKLLLEQQKKPKEKRSKSFSITSDSDKLVQTEDLDIPQEVIEKILKELHKFEENNRFAKKHYTLNSLAKELNTNSAYLSKIINVYKNINFANYLNNLRIDFAIDQLTANKSLRSYTIKAIAEEVGFKNAQSFSSAFYKKTGIYTSYFIKQINN